MASNKPIDVTPYLAGPLYAVAVLFVLMPVVDVISQVWPPSLGNPSWRYGLVGLGANYLISVAFGSLLACVVAAYQWHRRTLRWVAIANAAFAVLAVLATVGFVLDVLQIRPGLPQNNPAGVRLFNIGAAKAVFKYLVTAVAFAWVALGALRAARAIPAAPGEADAPKLVSQQSKKS